MDGVKTRKDYYKQAVFVCAFCGKEFEGRVRPDNTNRFCSRSHSASHRGKRPDIALRARERCLTNNPGKYRTENSIKKHALTLKGRPMKGRIGKKRGQLTKQQALIAERLNLATEYPISTVSVKHLFPDAKYAYDVDCAHINTMTAIEVDGKSHRCKKQVECDRKKTEILLALGWTVMRFWNWDIDADPDKVCSEIQAHINDKLNHK